MQHSTSDLLQIQASQGIAQVEREIIDLAKKRPTRLSLPSFPKKRWVGGEAALIQLLITWGAQTRDAKLTLHVQNDQTETQILEQLRKLAARPFGFVALWMADDVLNRQGDSIRQLAKRCGDDAIRAMRTGYREDYLHNRPGQKSLWGDDDEELTEMPRISGYGSTVFLASVDHHLDWRLPQCYYMDDKVKSRDDFIGLAAIACKRASRSTSDEPIPQDLRRPFGTILHELFKNTHLWARHDPSGSSFLRSVRGFFLERHSGSLKEIDAAAEGAPALLNFFHHQKIVRSDDRVRFFELSFFDSGVGLAERWLKDRKRWNPPISPEDELIACMECLQKHNTSSNLDHRGIGLFEVMTTLSDLCGFLRIRTGHLSLYRDFIANPFDEHSNTPESYQLMDWITCSSTPSRQERVQGTLYTILIPVIAQKG